MASKRGGEERTNTSQPDRLKATDVYYPGKRSGEYSLLPKKHNAIWRNEG
jgi:hypothetical protein